MGTPTTVPASSSGSSSYISRRTISMPFNSSPWTAAVRHRWGPGLVPWATSTGTGVAMERNDWSGVQ